MRKKKVFIHSDFSLARTGFGRNSRAVCEYLHNTGKYDIVNFCCAQAVGNPELDRTPWKSIGGISPQKIHDLKQKNHMGMWGKIEQDGGYGAYDIEEVIKAEKPDAYIGIQDIWGVNFNIDKPWFKKIPSVIWTTLDSLPILQGAQEVAPRIKYYWSWADFATKALHKLGHKHVETVRGAVDTKFFRRLSDETRQKLRERHGIKDNPYIIGFVFRNQLRKSVPNLLEGFSLFKKEVTNSKLLLHTCWTETWNIPKLMKEYNIKEEDVLTTYICPHCMNYDVRQFTGPHTDCRHCGAKGINPQQNLPHGQGMVTPNPAIGVNEEQLNEVYNLMDVYIHPFTSGGQEIPIQEAKLTELVTLVTNYSCGEDSCQPEAASLPLEYAEYREVGTEFIKASTYPQSIAKQLSKAYNMKPEQRRAMGKQARQWVIDNFSIEVIGKRIENFLDGVEYTTYDFVEKFVPRDPYAQIQDIQDNEKWLVEMYNKILARTERDEGGVKYWLQELSKGADKKGIENFFRQTAIQENQQNNKIEFSDLLNKNDKGRVLFIQPESAGDIFLCTALFKSVKERYPEWTLYVATKPEYKPLIDGNPYVDKWIEYNPNMDNLIWLEGSAFNDGYFDIAYQPYVRTQKAADYWHNGVDKIDFAIK
jgi:glycosyltransferase involved in cell wall biosynthesis